MSIEINTSTPLEAKIFSERNCKNIQIKMRLLSNELTEGDNK